MSSGTASSSARNHPEHKVGPFDGGVGVAIWVNNVENDDGSRRIRSVTISPRRYRDSKTGKWRDSGSYRPSDLPALIYALEKAQEFIYENPLPGRSEAAEEDEQHDDPRF